MAIDDDSPTTKHLQLESIPLVDLRLLSQSELNSLSLISTSNNESFDRCCYADDIVIPKIDRSVFNESAGSRKQTYNRLHFAPTPSIQHSNLGLGGRNRRGFFSSSGISKNPNKNGKSPNFFGDDDDDHEIRENKRIVTLLRELFAKETGGDMVVYEAVNVENGGYVKEEEEVKEEAGEERERKRKRGRRRKDPSLKKNGKEGKLLLLHDVVDDSKAIVLQGNAENQNGDVVDIAALANMDDPYGPELRRRSVGLETENELLGFLGGLEGKWASTRKKRKIVDAGDFGDHLPNGWRILLGLKRKGGQVWLYCRRYISPCGQQFESMKEVSSYLHSIFGTKDTNQPNTHHSADICGANSLASESVAGLPHRDEKTREGYSCHQASPQTPLFTEHENQVTPAKIENLALVEVKDLLVCRKCNTSYGETDAYMQHLLTTHQSKNKNRLCSSISDGVIMNDGKYECQFCHKIFLEKHRYNGHVGNHVKNYVRRLEASSGKTIVPKRIQQSSSSAAPSVICKVDELLDINKGSTLKTSAKPNDELNVEAPQSKPVTETSSAKLNNDKINVEAPCSTSAMDSVSATSNGKSDYDEMNIEASQSKPGTYSVPETFNAKLNNDQMSVEAPCSTPAMDSVSGAFSAKPDSAEMNVEAPQCIIPVTNSVAETSNTNLNNDEVTVEAPLSTPVADSVSGAFSAKSDSDEMNVEAPQFIIPDTNSVAETSNTNLNNDEVTVETPLSTPVADSVSGAFSAKSDNDEMNVEAPQCIIPVTNSVVETSNVNLNNDKMTVEAPLSTPVADSVLGTFSAKSDNEEMNIEAPHCIIPVTNSVVETSNTNLNNDEMTVEAPLRTPVADSVPGAFSAKSDYVGMNVEAPQGIIPVTNSVVETSDASLNNDEINVEAPLCTVADPVVGTFNAKTNLDEMNVEAPQCMLPVTSSVAETSENLNNDDMNEAPLSTGADHVLGTFNAKRPKTNLDEMNVDVMHCTPAMGSSTSRRNDGSPHCKLDYASISETSAPKFNWELNLASPYGNQDRDADKMKESLADESCDKQYSVYEIPDKLGEIHDEPNNNLFGTFNSCLYSESILSSDQGNVTSRTSNGEYVFGSTSDEVGKYGLGQEAGSESCWLTLSTGQQINEIATTSVNKGFSLYPKDSQLCEAQESGNNVLENCFGMRGSEHVKNVVPETIGSSTDEGNLLLDTMVADTSMELMKSSNFFPTFSMISDKGENDFRTVNQRIEKVSDFEDLKLDDIDPSKFNFLIGQESNSLQEEQSMGLGYDADLQQHGLGTSDQFDWDSILPNMDSRQQQQQLITTVCVWCGMEFNLDTLDPALVEPDSVGYMCPSCKAKISGQIKYI